MWLPEVASCSSAFYRNPSRPAQERDVHFKSCLVVWFFVPSARCAARHHCSRRLHNGQPAASKNGLIPIDEIVLRFTNDSLSAFFRSEPDPAIQQHDNVVLKVRRKVSYIIVMGKYQEGTYMVCGCMAVVVVDGFWSRSSWLERLFNIRSTYEVE